MQSEFARGSRSRECQNGPKTFYWHSISRADKSTKHNIHGSFPRDLVNHLLEPAFDEEGARARAGTTFDVEGAETASVDVEGAGTERLFLWTCRPFICFRPIFFFITSTAESFDASLRAAYFLIKSCRNLGSNRTASSFRRFCRRSIARPIKVSVSRCPGRLNWGFVFPFPSWNIFQIWITVQLTDMQNIQQTTALTLNH